MLNCQGLAKTRRSCSTIRSKKFGRRRRLWSDFLRVGRSLVMDGMERDDENKDGRKGSYIWWVLEENTWHLWPWNSFWSFFTELIGYRESDGNLQSNSISSVLQAQVSKCNKLKHDLVGFSSDGRMAMSCQALLSRIVKLPTPHLHFDAVLDEGN